MFAQPDTAIGNDRGIAGVPVDRLSAFHLSALHCRYYHRRRSHSTRLTAARQQGNNLSGAKRSENKYWEE
jgi:hypothetical protein